MNNKAYKITFAALCVFSFIAGCTGATHQFWLCIPTGIMYVVAELTDKQENKTI